MKILMVTLFYFFFLFIQINSQTVSQQEKEELISHLYTNSSIGYSNTIDDIIQLNVLEAVPIIEELIWEKEPVTQLDFLRGLVFLNSNKAKIYVYAYIDSLSNCDTTDFWNFQDCESFKASAVGLLFQLEDYSQKEYAYVFWEKHKLDNLKNQAMGLLFDLIKRFPYSETRARDELELEVQSSSENGILALMYLESIFKEETIPLIINKFNSGDVNLKLTLLYEYFTKYKTPSMKNTMKNLILEGDDNYTTMETLSVIVNFLLTPQDYKFILDWISDENSNIDLIENVKFNMENYWVIKPLEPDSTVPVETMLDTLISYTDQCYGYEWITNNGTYKSLTKKLDGVKKDLEKGNEEPAVNKLEAYQNEVETQKDKHITEEGYKFLYYYSQYILDRLLKIPETKTNEK